MNVFDLPEFIKIIPKYFTFDGMNPLFIERDLSRRKWFDEINTVNKLLEYDKLKINKFTELIKE